MQALFGFGKDKESHKSKSSSSSSSSSSSNSPTGSPKSQKSATGKKDRTPDKKAPKTVPGPVVSNETKAKIPPAPGPLVDNGVKTERASGVGERPPREPVLAVCPPPPVAEDNRRSKDIRPVFAAPVQRQPQNAVPGPPAAPGNSKQVAISVRAPRPVPTYQNLQNRKVVKSSTG